ncbi:MAG: GFA family protein [Sphingomonas bacterium]
MTEAISRHTGGCLCGRVRYEAEGKPLAAGYCCCTDCRKASGSGFIPFLAFASSAVRFSGETFQFRSPSFRGSEAVRNRCAACGSLVFGGIVGVDSSHTIYAGSLDDPGIFKPTMAIFTRDCPDWAILPEGLQAFEAMPG